jgi:hypothetical protein
VRFGGTVQVAFAGASAFAGLASLSSLGPQAKASAYAVAGKLSFDIASVTTSRYTHTYQNWLVVSNELKQDMGIYPTGKKYAVAAFADVGIYQILKYDPQTRTASAIPGKSLWFNVESRPYWDVYEYSREEELSIPQQLEPFERVNVEVSESDLYKALSKTYAKTRSSGGNEDLTGIRYSSTDETYKPDLFIPALKQFGYTKLRIDVEFAYKGDWVLFGVGALRLQIANSNKSTELGRKDFDYTTSWTTKSYSVTVPIDAVNSDTGQFMLLWSRVENDGLFSANQSVGKRTVTITALK